MICIENKDQITISIPENLFNRISRLSEINEQIDKKTCFLLVSKIYDLQLKNDLFNDWIHLCSKLIRKVFDSNNVIGAVQLNYLVEEGILFNRPHINNINGLKNRCSSYKFNYNYE